MSKFEIMEKRDEEQILAEAQGNIIEEMFYKFPIDGKTVTGISWVGTKEIARQYGGIKMGIPQVTDLGEDYACSIQATDTKNDVTLVGSSMQPKNMALRNGGEKPDRFAYTKAVSKAQRNAIRALIPETFLLKMEKRFSEGINSIPSSDVVRRKVASEFKEKVEENKKKLTEDTTFDLSENGIKSALEQLGYNSELFDIRHDEPTRMYVIDKKPWLDNLPEFNIQMRELGGEYNAEYKKTVFRY